VPDQWGAGLRLPQLSPQDGALAEASGPVLDAQVALGEGYGAAMACIRSKVRDLTAPWQVGKPLGVVVEGLNPVLRGWGAYFRQGNSSAKFSAIDAYVHERMARLASRKLQRQGIGWSERFTWDWLTKLGIHRLDGTVRYPAAHA
jgi:RNA-directed DNA polymerase